MHNMSTWDVEAWSIATKYVFVFRKGSVKTTDVLEDFRSLETSEQCGQSLLKFSAL